MKLDRTSLVLNRFYVWENFFSISNIVFFVRHQLDFEIELRRHFHCSSRRRSQNGEVLLTLGRKIKLRRTRSKNVGHYSSKCWGTTNIRVLILESWVCIASKLCATGIRAQKLIREKEILSNAHRYMHSTYIILCI